MSIRAALIPALVCLGSPAFGQLAWVGSWGASPLPPTAAGGFFPATPEFEDQTIRQIVRLSAGGAQIRLRLSNEYGIQPLRIGAARVAIADGETGIVRGSERAVTFSGAVSTVIPPGAPLLSDPIDLEVDELESISIALYFPDNTGQCTCHQVGLQPGYVADGDASNEVIVTDTRVQSRAFITGVEVLGDAAGAVVALGDSITDGVGSTSGANNRWPDVLAERLAARSGPGFGVVNHGISGNRVLADGAGESALARFDRDVLSVAGVTHVVIFEGINDLGIGFGSFGGPAGSDDGITRSPGLSAEAMIAGYRQIIARAHARGLRVYGATIAPYEGAGYYSEAGERVRQAVNAWIRDSGEFDAVLDFDAILRDPEQTSRMAAGMHSGDFLHGSDAGYEAMAQSIDLSLFR